MKQYIQEYTAEMNPKTARGRRKIVVMARSCVITDRAERESVAVAHNVRNAFERFYAERKNAAATQFDALREDPRNNLRTLRKSPERVDCLIDTWHDLRADPKPTWTAAHLEQATHTLGCHTGGGRCPRAPVLVAPGDDLPAPGLKAEEGRLVSGCRAELRKIAGRASAWGYVWHDYLPCELFCREAEALNGVAAPRPPEGKAAGTPEAGAAPPLPPVKPGPGSGAQGERTADGGPA
jgi:hypothetical protein